MEQSLLMMNVIVRVLIKSVQIRDGFFSCENKLMWNLRYKLFLNIL
jgi:hypothetical protein